MFQSILWFIVFAFLAGLGFWLGTVMPVQAWAEWDGWRWQIVAEGWAVLWRGWPLMVFGTLVGASLSAVVLAFTLKHAQAADFQAEIARLTRQKETLQAAVEQRVQGREQAAWAREARAAEAQRAADVAQRQAQQAQETAQQTTEQARRRVRNAIAAAERIKRRQTGSTRIKHPDR